MKNTREATWLKNLGGDACRMYSFRSKLPFTCILILINYSKLHSLFWLFAFLVLVRQSSTVDNSEEHGMFHSP